MSTISKLDDLEIYLQALKLVQKVYKLCKHSCLSKEFALIDQLKRSSLSIAANIAEGYGRQTKKEFSQFLSISLGSLSETIAFLDFINLEFSLNTITLKTDYLLLARRIHSFRHYLKNCSLIKKSNN